MTGKNYISKFSTKKSAPSSQATSTFKIYEKHKYSQSMGHNKKKNVIFKQISAGLSSARL